MHRSDFGSKLFLQPGSLFCFQTYEKSMSMEGRNMGYAGRQNIYEGAIRKMVTQALEAKEEAFRTEHGTDTEGQLIAYLRLCSEKLQHTPWPGEILGGTVIAERFGSWEKALAAANLPRPRTENKPSSFLRVQREEERQKEIYRRRKAEKKILSEQRRLRQEARRKETAKKK